MAQKVCVVFGFGPGIGAACARRWLREGFKVAILARNKEKLQAFEAKHGGSGITKGQLNSEGIDEVIISPQMQT